MKYENYTKNIHTIMLRYFDYNEKKVTDWMWRPNMMMQGMSPMQMLKNNMGARLFKFVFTTFSSPEDDAA